MMRKYLTLLAVVPALVLGGCEIGTKVVEQNGPRGLAIEQIKHKATMRTAADVPPPPYELTPDMREGERASAAYENVQVLGDISVDEFNYTMAALTEWVAPADGTVENGGCNYCHNPANMASDEIYTKVVARRMLQMTRAINANWTPHFNNNYGQSNENAGVTCWTCHRGKPLPANSWSDTPPTPTQIKGNKRGQNTPLVQTAYASLPYDAFSAYLSGDGNIRVLGKSAYPNQHEASIVATETTYGLMMHMSQGLGVNCVFCHNSQNFGKWDDSRAQRVNAFTGIRMVRDINNNYISALGDVWPANRRGPAGDPLKVNCATCHNGINRPLGGVKMLKDYPSLKGVHSTAPPAPAASQPIPGISPEEGPADSGAQPGPIAANQAQAKPAA
ncbi:photosynthetic reaction center cytochrome PufC [Polymorphobacter sp.]|uniref:photosynthetic reaction center cytochrome PufC n=1 Tax=Polymorphobacter sp. TaxID=1909290 RepID=UPI003F6FDC43